MCCEVITGVEVGYRRVSVRQNAGWVHEVVGPVIENKHRVHQSLLFHSFNLLRTSNEPITASRRQPSIRRNQASPLTPSHLHPP